MRKSHKGSDTTNSRKKKQRKPAARVSISTTTFSKAYLARAWSSRNQLQDYERRGFAQFFYLTICGHVEAILAAVIKRRLSSIRHLTNWNTLVPVELRDDNGLHHCPVTPVVESLVQILKATDVEADSAPLSTLLRLFGRVFPQPLRDVLGSELQKDLMALAALRNLFAHGRDLIMEFDNLTKGQGILEGNPLEKPAQRLHKASIIRSVHITHRNYLKFQAVFFGDDALKYFYERVQRIAEKFEAFNTFLPEKRPHFITELPSLGSA